MTFMKQALKDAYFDIVTTDVDRHLPRNKWVVVISDGDATSFQEPCRNGQVVDTNIQNLLNGTSKTYIKFHFKLNFF